MSKTLSQVFKFERTLFDGRISTNHQLENPSKQEERDIKDESPALTESHSAIESAASLEVDTNQPIVRLVPINLDDHIVSNEEANIDIQPGPSGLNSKQKDKKN